MTTIAPRTAPAQGGGKSQITDLIHPGIKLIQRDNRARVLGISGFFLLTFLSP